MDPRKIQHFADLRRWILHSQASAQRRNVSAPAKDQPHAGGIHKGDSAEIQRQQFRHMGVDLGVDLPPQRLRRVMVDLPVSYTHLFFCFRSSDQNICPIATNKQALLHKTQKGLTPHQSNGVRPFILSKY